jgi:hypothetical protein
VIAHFVTQRTSEIGLRLAFVATPGSVLVTTLLFETTPTDLPTYVAGGIGLMTVALLACAVPVFRAVRISPMQSLAEW